MVFKNVKNVKETHIPYDQYIPYQKYVQCLSKGMQKNVRSRFAPKSPREQNG